MTRGTLHIHHATIRDFRGIDALELDLPEGDAPGESSALELGGDNGFGKTTVLEALALALGRGDLLPPDSATLAEQVRFGCRDFSIELEVACDGRDLRLKCNRAPRVVCLSARRDPDGLHASDMDNAPLSGESRRIAALKKTLISLYNRKQTRRPPAPDDRPGRFERLQRFVRRFLGEDATVDVMFIDDSDRNGQEVVLRRGEFPEGVALAKAHVLVEDELTQATLATAWGDVNVRVEHVGGVGAVRAMVKDARGRKATESVTREATSYALRCCPWMAARRTLMEIDHGLNENFPGAPDLGQ